MTAQRTIARLRKENTELRERTKIVVDDNTFLAEENRRLKNIMKSDQETIELLVQEKKNCKQKCELAIREKDAIISERDRRLSKVKAFGLLLEEITWTKTVKHDSSGTTISFHGVSK